MKRLLPEQVKTAEGSVPHVHTSFSPGHDSTQTLRPVMMVVVLKKSSWLIQ